MIQRILALGSRALPVFVGLGVLVLWYAVRAGMSSEQRFLLPAPHEVLQAMIDNRADLASAAISTASGAIIGFGCAVLLSFALALVLSLSRKIRASFYPYLMILQMTPIIVLAPILILWVGPGLQSVATITFLICFFPMVVNTTQGLISTDPNLVDLFRLYGASRREETFLLRVPAASPYFFTGLRIAATLAPIGAVVGDFYAGNSAGGKGGLGFLTIIYSSQFKMSALFATAAVSCLLGFVFVACVVSLSWLALHKWHDSYARKDA